MSNHVKKAERDTIYAEAEKIVTLRDGWGRVENYQQCRDELMTKFSISQDRARTAIAHAARRQRNRFYDYEPDFPISISPAR